jgi:hypothetical protein
MKVLIITGVLLIITVAITFYIMNKSLQRVFIDQVEAQARVLFKQIILTRRWIADHGGIFVQKLPWVGDNLYLENNEIVDVTGRRYVRENPALVTLELSEYSRREGLYWFHITSLDLVNPANAPDEFETKAIRL